MPELPPPLPELTTQQPPQSAPAVNAASSSSPRWSVQPLADRANCIVGCAVIFVVIAIGATWMIQAEMRSGPLARTYIERSSMMIGLALFWSWLAVWTALSRERWWLRAIVFAAVALLCILESIVSKAHSFSGLSTQLLMMGVILNGYFLLMSFFRFRYARAKKLLIENSVKSDFVLIPTTATRAEANAYADWYFYRKSPASGRMDAFRPMQFHLRQIFYVSIYIAFVCVALRGIVSLMFRADQSPYSYDRYNSDLMTQLIIELVCFAGPVCYSLIALAMWVSLGKRRWLIRFLTLVAITFAIIFLYKFFSTLGIMDLVLDFKLTFDTIQTFVFAFCTVSLWMIVARCLGYRIIRLPLTIPEKIGSENSSAIRNAF